MADNRLYSAVKVTTLNTPAALGATSITPTVIQDREGNTISNMATYFGTKGFGVISPGKDKEEHFVFTGISGGSLTGVSHVTMVAPYTETSGLTEAHAVGEVVVIYSNTPAFHNDFINKNNDETMVQTLTLTESAMPRISAQHTYVAGEEEYLATKRYVDSVGSAGASDGNTTTKGLFEEATDAELQAGTATGGTGARLAAGGASHTQTPTANKVPVAESDGKLNQGWIDLSETFNFTGDVQLDGTTVTATAAQLNEAGTFFGSTDITASEAETLTDGSDASGLHHHGVAILSATRDTGTATGSQTIAHGLGKAPRYIEIYVSTISNAGDNYITCISNGYSDGSTHKSSWIGTDSNASSGTLPTTGVDTSACVHIDAATNATTDALQTATASFDATNVTLNWTLVGSGSLPNPMNIVILAHA